MTGKLRFHHIGVITSELGDAIELYRKLGYEAGPRFEDPVQHLSIVFMKRADGPLIELIQPKSEQSPAHDWVRRIGAGPYHTAYLVAKLDDAMVELQRLHLKKVYGPVPAVAFGGKPVAFFWNPAVGLVELVEE